MTPMSQVPATVQFSADASDIKYEHPDAAFAPERAVAPVHLGVWIGATTLLWSIIVVASLHLS
jgi:hypothetical protein